MEAKTLGALEHVGALALIVVSGEDVARRLNRREKVHHGDEVVRVHLLHLVSHCDLVAEFTITDERPGDVQEGKTGGYHDEQDRAER